MCDVDLPKRADVPGLVRSFAACLASVTDSRLSDVPLPRAHLPGAIAHWRSWFAARGTGLAPIADPARFNWPGYWRAVLRESGPSQQADHKTAVLMFGTPFGVMLSPQDPGLLGVAASDLPVRA